MKSYGSGANKPKKLLKWIWKETSAAFYLAMLKSQCHEIIRVWFSSNRKRVVNTQTKRYESGGKKPNSYLQGLEGNYHCPVSCDVKGLVSRDYSRLVFVQYKVVVDSHKKIPIRSQDANKAQLIWIWQFTSTALYPTTLKGQCHSKEKVWIPIPQPRSQKAPIKDLEGYQCCYLSCNLEDLCHEIFRCWFSSS